MSKKRENTYRYTIWLRYENGEIWTYTQEREGPPRAGMLIAEAGMLAETVRKMYGERPIESIEIEIL